MAKRTVDLNDKNRLDKHRLKTYLTVLKGYLQCAYTVCTNIENNQKLFPVWDDNVAIYITAALDLIYEMESRYGSKQW